MFHAICAEASLEKVDNATMLELPGLNLEQIVGEGEQPETRSPQLAKRCRNLLMRWHRRKFFGQLFLIGVVNLDALRVRLHLHDGRADVGEGNVAPRHSQGRGIQDEVGKPEAHVSLVAKDALEGRLHGLKIEQRLIDVEYDQWKGSHYSLLLFGRAHSSPFGLTILLVLESYLICLASIDAKSGARGGEARLGRRYPRLRIVASGYDRYA